jgi:hypothetical protein
MTWGWALVQPGFLAISMQDSPDFVGLGNKRIFLAGLQRRCNKKTTIFTNQSQFLPGCFAFPTFLNDTTTSSRAQVLPAK